MNANTVQSTRHHHPGPNPEEERAATSARRRTLCAEAVAAYRGAWRRVRTLREPPRDTPPVTCSGPRYAYPNQRGRWAARGWHQGRNLFFGTFGSEAEARAETLRRLAELKAREDHA